MYKAILFDLDGTLTESGEGITKCVQYALEKLGRPESDLEKLKVFIGPPLMEQFMKYADLDEATARKAVEYYRERYSTTGIFEVTMQTIVSVRVNGQEKDWDTEGEIVRVHDLVNEINLLEIAAMIPADFTWTGEKKNVILTYNVF